jgi:predicted DNA-binding protein
MKEQKNTERITFRLPEEMCQQLSQLADRRGASPAEMIREILRAYLIRQ